MAQKYCDESGYEVNFEDDIPESERQHYLKVFPTVDKVAERRIHCTSCNSHIGTAPFAEARIRMHPVLKVTHCRNCHSFYNSGEFDKGEDGSELYCRWCGQGGEVYCCSSCPYVFCKKCIVQNFSRSMITEIEKQDNWECFSCSPQILFNLRSQHWALVNFIEKQTKEIIRANLPSDIHEERMSHDSTTCCRRKTEVAKKAPTPAAKKRSASPAKAPPAKKPPERVFRASTLLNGGTSAPPLAVSSRPAQQPTRAASSANLVCAPDILSMFSDADPSPSPVSPAAPPRLILQPTTTTTRRPTVPENPPPLAVRQYSGSTIRPVGTPQQKQPPIPMVQITHGPRPVAGSFARSGAAGGAPVYHTIQGFRIDLNCAANQETFRLPNGKYIQVKKQPPALAPLPAARNQLRNSLGQALVNNYQQRYSNPGHPQIQQQQRVIQLQQPTQIQQIRAPSTGLSLVPPPMTLEKPSHPPTPLGMARNAFEFKVLNTLEVCHQIIGKINTLTNYPSYKTVNHISELKDLYKHLSYLLSYTVGRFKTLQDKCAQETKDLGFDEDSTEKTTDGADDELEVVEQQTTVIEIDSDAEPDTETEVQSSSGSTPLRPILEPRPSISSIDSESVPPSISSIIDEFNDPKLRLEPRVEVIRAECLIPSVNQLLKNEVKNATEMIQISLDAEKDEENPQTEEEDDLMSNLLEVTPDISVMMGTNDDEEADKVSISDGEDDVVEISDSPCSEKPVSPSNDNAEEGEIVGNVEKAKENEALEVNTSKDDDEDVVMLDDDETDNTLKPDETIENVEKEKENEKNVEETNEVAEKDKESEENAEKTNENVEKEKNNEENASETVPDDKNDEKSESMQVDESPVEEETPKEVPIVDKNDKSHDVSTVSVEKEAEKLSETTETSEKEPTKPLEPEINEKLASPESDISFHTPEPEIPVNDLPVDSSLPSNDVEMTEISDKDIENIQSNTTEVTENGEKSEERQLTLQDVELLDDDLNPEKELDGALNKTSDDLSIEDFNLGENELNALADNLVQEGWDI